MLKHGCQHVLHNVFGRMVGTTTMLGIAVDKGPVTIEELVPRLMVGPFSQTLQQCGVRIAVHNDNEFSRPVPKKYWEIRQEGITNLSVRRIFLNINCRV